VALLGALAPAAAFAPPGGLVSRHSFVAQPVLASGPGRLATRPLPRAVPSPLQRGALGCYGTAAAEKVGAWPAPSAARPARRAARGRGRGHVLCVCGGDAPADAPAPAMALPSNAARRGCPGTVPAAGQRRRAMAGSAGWLLCCAHVFAVLSLRPCSVMTLPCAPVQDDDANKLPAYSKFGQIEVKGKAVSLPIGILFFVGSFVWAVVLFPYVLLAYAFSKAFDDLRRQAGDGAHDARVPVPPWRQARAPASACVCCSCVCVHHAPNLRPCVHACSRCCCNSGIRARTRRHSIHCLGGWVGD